MTAPTCSARTWVTPDEVVTCDKPAGHDGHEDHRPRCCIAINRSWHIYTVDEARDLRDRIQRQLDALDPDAAIAEAERRMLDAFDRRVRLLRIADLYGELLGPIEAAAEEAKTAQRAAYDTWLALVEARDAKDGGA